MTQTKGRDTTPSDAGHAGSAQTGQGTAPPELDVADPHPSDEGDPYDARRPGGTHPPKKDIGPNPAAHDGEAPRRPHNAGSGPE